MRKLMIAILLLITGTVFGQTYFQSPSYFNGGKSVSVYFSDVDSTVTYTTNWIDISTIDAQSISIITDFIASANDSLQILVQGRVKKTGNTYVQWNLDTILVKGSTNSGASATVHQLLTLSSFAPEARLSISQYIGAGVGYNANNNTLSVTLYTKDNDYIPPRNYYFW